MAGRRRAGTGARRAERLDAAHALGDPGGRADRRGRACGAKDPLGGWGLGSGALGCLSRAPNCPRNARWVWRFFWVFSTLRVRTVRVTFVYKGQKRTLQSNQNHQAAMEPGLLQESGSMSRRRRRVVPWHQATNPPTRSDGLGAGLDVRSFSIIRGLVVRLSLPATVPQLAAGVCVSQRSSPRCQHDPWANDRAGRREAGVRGLDLTERVAQLARLGIACTPQRPARALPQGELSLSHRRNGRHG